MLIIVTWLYYNDSYVQVLHILSTCVCACVGVRACVRACVTAVLKSTGLLCQRLSCIRGIPNLSFDKNPANYQ